MRWTAAGATPIARPLHRAARVAPWANAAGSDVRRRAKAPGHGARVGRLDAGARQGRPPSSRDRGAGCDEEDIKLAVGIGKRSPCATSRRDKVERHAVVEEHLAGRGTIRVERDRELVGVRSHRDRGATQAPLPRRHRAAALEERCGPSIGAFGDAPDTLTPRIVRERRWAVNSAPAPRILAGDVVRAAAGKYASSFRRRAPRGSVTGLTSQRRADHPLINNAPLSRTPCPPTRPDLSEGNSAPTAASRVNQRSATRKHRVEINFTASRPTPHFSP